MSRKSLGLWLAAALTVWLIASPSDSEEPTRPDPDRVAVQPDRPSAAPAAEPSGSHEEARRDRERRDRDSRRSEPKPRSGQTAEPRSGQAPPPTHLVVGVVDGDTVDLGNGERVRLVGIDTPEQGECGYEKAAEALAAMVLGEQVVLRVSDEARDGYGRLLRYVDVDGTDAGLQLIRRGLAIARYDSRDGYGFHPREPEYVAADRGTKPVCPRVAPLADVPAQPAGGSCAPGYQPCIPPSPPDLDCADVGGPVRVSGIDPHRLDGDGDGLACE